MSFGVSVGGDLIGRLVLGENITSTVTPLPSEIGALIELSLLSWFQVRSAGDCNFF